MYEFPCGPRTTILLAVLNRTALATIPFMDAFLESIRDNKALLGWLGALSIVMFVGTLALVPFLVVKIPEDYFTHRRRQIDGWDHYHPAVRWTLITLKNVMGGIFVLAGLAMLVLPGQGLITLLIGIVMLNFPGKYRIERWIIRRKPIHRTINWMRAKAHHPPLEVPET